MPAKRLTNLTAETVTLLRRYAEETTTRRTEILKQVAEHLVDLREFYVTPSGEPDWSGRTYAYKRAVSDIYAEAGLTDQRASIATSVRYHVSNALRTRLTAAQLEHLDLIPVSARERSAEHRARQSAFLSAFRPAPVLDEDGDGPGVDIESLQATVGARRLLASVRPQRVAQMNRGRRQALRAELRQIGAETRRIGELIDATDAADD